MIEFRLTMLAFFCAALAYLSATHSLRISAIEAVCLPPKIERGAP